MTDDNAVNTAENSGKKATGKPFVKGDPRINRNGRPRSLDGFRKLIQGKMNEAATTPDGKPITRTVGDKEYIVTNAEMFVEAWMKSKDRKSFAEFAYGKVTDRVEHTGKDGEPLIPKDDSDTRSEILRKLDSIATATGAAGVSKPTNGN